MNMLISLSGFVCLLVWLIVGGIWQGKRGILSAVPCFSKTTVRLGDDCWIRADFAPLAPDLGSCFLYFYGKLRVIGRVGVATPFYVPVREVRFRLCNGRVGWMRNWSSKQEVWPFRCSLFRSCWIKHEQVNRGNLNFGGDWNFWRRECIFFVVGGVWHWVSHVAGGAKHGAKPLH